MTRILHLLAPAPFGGLESVVQSLATGQADRGHEVCVTAILDPGIDDHPLLAALRARNVTTRAINVPTRGYGQERARVRELCTTLRPDVVHSHGYRTDVLHTPVARQLRIPVVSTSHGFTGGDIKNRVYEYLQRRAFRRCSAVIAVSRPMHAAIVAAGVPAQQVHCIPNAWSDEVTFAAPADARQRLGLTDRTPCFAFIGRLSHEKGADTFVEAVMRLGGEAQAVIIGDGPLRSSLVKRAASIDAARIQWCGAVPNAGALVRAFDAVILSSRTEGTPIVLLETIAAGVPVVATAVGGIPDIVSTDEAVLVRPDDPDALAAAIRHVLGDRDAASDRAARALQRLRAELSASAWLDRYDTVYAEAQARAAAAPRRAAIAAG